MKSEEQDSLQQEWVRIAPAWIRETRAGRNASRDGLLDKPMLEACGDVQGMAILDCGCGEGRFSRMLIERGAQSVLGLDLCGPMIEAAKGLASGRDEYLKADVQDLSFLSGSRFDLAVSYLNQCDLKDFAANTREVFRVLKPGGRFVAANLHPMRSATGDWERNPDGSKRHVVLDDYFDEGERRWKMMGEKLTNFHRTLGTYFNSYRDAGFAIDRIIEPSVDRAGLERYPELDDELRVPNFILFVLRRPGTDLEQEY